MRVSDSHRVLFVHVPKTGGSTIDALFDEAVPDARKVVGAGRHAPYSRLVKVEPALADYWAFGFVRNPWARLVSYWSMVRAVFEKVDAGDPEAIAKIERHPGAWLPEGEYRDSFERFVLEGSLTVPKIGRPQLTALSRQGRQVDFIGRIEDFDAGVAVVRERLGLPDTGKAPQRNRSTHGDYRDYYTPETRDRVAELFAVDLEAFGYEF